MKTAQAASRPPATINPLSGKPILAIPFAVIPSAATGPTTPQGKAIASRNATTHGLFARDIVLPSLGEDPEGYRQLADEFSAQIAPRNLLGAALCGEDRRRLLASFGDCIAGRRSFLRMRR